MMICVSPLSRKSGTGCHARSSSKAPETPINFHNIFASPKADVNSREMGDGSQLADASNEIPRLSGLTTQGTHTSASGPTTGNASSAGDEESKLALEKHVAERDIMEDDDLNVLLKLAETTPRRSSGDGKGNPRVFRGAGGAFAYPANEHQHPLHPHSHAHHGPPSSLHLPMIGGKTENSSATPRLGHKITSDSDYKFDSSMHGKIQIHASGKHPASGKHRKAISSPKKRKSSGGQGKGAPKCSSAPTQAPAAPSQLYQGHPMPPHLQHRPPPGYYPPPYMHTPGMPPYPPYAYSRNGHPPPPPYMYPSAPVPAGAETVKGMKKTLKKGCGTGTSKSGAGSKRPLSAASTASKRAKKAAKGRGPGKKKSGANASNVPVDKQRTAATISAINSASGKKNDKAASLASSILRGVTMRPSGKWQAQLYFAGKSRYIGVFDSREKAALAYEIAREKLQNKNGVLSAKDTEAFVNAARKAAFEGVNESHLRAQK